MEYIDYLEAAHYDANQPEPEYDEDDYTDCGEIELGEQFPDYM